MMHWRDWWFSRCWIFVSGIRPPSIQPWKCLAINCLSNPSIEDLSLSIHAVHKLIASPPASLYVHESPFEWCSNHVTEDWQYMKHGFRALLYFLHPMFSSEKTSQRVHKASPCRHQTLEPHSYRDSSMSNQECCWVLHFRRTSVATVCTDSSQQSPYSSLRSVDSLYTEMESH